MRNSPLQVVKERFGDKQKLVSAVEKLATDELWLDRVNEVKGLSLVSNAKLLRLHDTLAAVKEGFGTRAKLIGAILELEKRTKDEGYRARLERYPTPRLLDLHRAATRRTKARERAAAAAPRPAVSRTRKARSRKAQAKAKA